MATTFTAQQLKNWKAYERVRKSGRFNMFDPRARRESGLDVDAYAFVMTNFSELKAAVESNTPNAKADLPEGKSR